MDRSEEEIKFNPLENTLYLKVVFPNGKSSIYRSEEEIDFNPLGYRVLVPLPSTGKGATAVVVKTFVGRFNKAIPVIDSFPDRYPVINPFALEILKGHLLEYLTTLGEAVFSLIPPELDWYQEIFVTAVDKKPVGLPKSVLSIFEKLRKRGKIEYEKLKKEYDWRIIQLLKEHNLLKVETKWIAPRFEERYYKLACDDTEVWEKVKRASSKRKEEIKKILEILNDRGEISHEELKTFVSSQTLRYLLSKEILQVSTYNVEGIKIKGLKQRELKAFGNIPQSGIYINLPLRERLKKIIQYGENVIAEGGDFLLIVPDLELFEYYHKELYPVFGDRLVVFNSKFPENEKLKNWFLAARDFPKIFLTTPKWIFAPLKKISAVWLEEESSPSYKMEKRPYFNLKRFALDLAKLTNAKLFISSEPPSLEIYLLKNRFEERIEEKKRVRVFLYEALNPFKEDTFLESVRNFGGKDVLFLVPKKGYSNLYCPRCGHFEECPRCDVLLTLTEGGKAVCNLCGYETELKNCTRCGEELQPFGYGVDRVKEIVERYIGNEDAKHFQYSTHPPAIGEYDAVFILFSDLLLSVPDFRKGEDLFQYLIKAKNRIKDNGFIFIHTRDSEHHAYAALVEDNPEAFYTAEVEYRKALELPPFSRIYLVAINLSEEKEETAKKLFRELNTKLKPFAVEVSFSKAPLFRLREKYRYQVLVKLPLKVEREILKETVKVLREMRNRYKFVRVIPNPRSVV